VSSRAVVVLLALLFLALHLPYLPSTLEDVDSINFALGLHHFDVALHQPHPPGYPIYIAIGKAARAVVGSDAKALAFVSLAAATLGVIAIAALFSRVGREDERWTAAGTALAVTSPLYWLTAARPLSDAVGLAAAVAVQAMTLAAATDRAIWIAAFCAGLAAGIRSQVLWLTVPLLFVKGLTPDKPGSRLYGVRPVTNVAFAVSAGLASWFVPLVALTGGPAAYWRALFSQGAEDLSGIRMLWTTPTARQFVEALYYAFVAPWAVWPIAALVIGCAVIGGIRLARSDGRELVLIAAAYGPYLVFDILFQETFTSRYALPVIVPVAFLCATGLRALPARPALALIVAAAMLNAHLGGRSVAAYARHAAPAFEMLERMRLESESAGDAPVLAPDRRQSFDLRRPIAWLGNRAPRFDRQLAAPPQHEWLEAVKYWNGGGRAPVWFALDPRRAAINLVQHSDPLRFRWALPYPVLISGTRPADVDWYRVTLPDWYAGDGWALSPESAGVAGVDHRGLEFGPIDAWVHRSAIAGGALVVGGRNFDASRRPRLTLSGPSPRSWPLAPGSFAEIVRLPFIEVDASAPEYVHVTLSASPPARVAIEQFDASAARAVVAFGPGWHEPEYDPASGRQWRWLSDRGELSYLTAAGDWKLVIEGERPDKYYRRASRVLVHTGDRVLADLRTSDDFTLEVPVPAAFDRPASLFVETDQTHVPAESRWRRSADRRILGLRIFRCELRRR
jgi:hypothetical protein